MDYSTDSNNKTYPEGNLSPRAPGYGQFGSQGMASAFSLSQSSRLENVNMDAQSQRRQQATSFDSSYQQPSPLHAGYTPSNPNNGLLSDPYVPLGMNSYDGGNIMDWGNSSRLDSNVSQIFQAPSSASQDWGVGLRIGSESLGGIQHSQPSSQFGSYDLNDLSPHPSQHMGNPLMSLNQRAIASSSRFSSSAPNSATPIRSFNGVGVAGGGGGPQSNPGTGGSNAQGRALNKMLLDILRERNVDPNRLAMAIDANIERMDCVNLATLLFHTGKKRLLLTPSFIKRIAVRFSTLKEELRAREASNALYGLKCMSSECPEVRQLVFALASKVCVSQTELVAQAVGNALYGCQMMTSEHEEVRYLLQVLSVKVANCTELLEAQNVGNALYGLRGMNSDCKEVRQLISALTPKVATAREELNGQALGNSLYGLQGMNSREPEVRNLLSVLASKVSRTWEDLKAQEVGNALYGLKRMNSDVSEVRHLIEALCPKVDASPEILDAQAIGNSFYGMQNMKSDNVPVLMLLATMAEKVMLSPAELDGQAMGNSLYGLQGMSSEQPEVRAVVNAITMKIQASCLEMNAQELGNALYGLQHMSSDYPETRRLMLALTQKVASSKHELTSQEIGNAIFGLQGMRSDLRETRVLVRQMAAKIQQSTSLIDPQGIANSLFGIQRMCSDSADVRLLLVALSNKIEQSWKLLSSQHISNSIFGLQGLCSNEEETRTLVHALVPKVLASRDEMSPKQVCNSLYGLKNMSSKHDEVRALVGALTEKLTLCAEVIPLQLLCAAFYGLQGMKSSFEEVQQLLAALCEKLVTVDEIDAFSLGNTIYGLQRMSTAQRDVTTVVELVSPMVAALAGSRLEIGPQVCANILYGVQNCSWSEECVRRMLRVISSRLKELLDAYSQSVIPLVVGSKDSVAATSMSLPDIHGLYQSLSLALQSYPDQSQDQELADQLQSHQVTLARIVEARRSEIAVKMLTPLERRLADGLSDVLAQEPFVVTTRESLFGFDAAVVVRLQPGVHMQNEDGSDWSPVVNFEVVGPAELTPTKELFGQLRTKFLKSKDVNVISIPASLINGRSRTTLAEGLRRGSALFSCLYPPSNSLDADGEHGREKLSSMLNAMGLHKSSSQDDDLLDSIRSSSSNTINTNNNTNSMDELCDELNGTNFIKLMPHDSISTETDDFPDLVEENDFFSQSKSPRQHQQVLQLIRGALGWIGEPPVMGNSAQTTPCSSPVSQYTSPHPLAIAQRRPPTAYNTVVASPMPPGYASRVVCPPFVQIGPPSGINSGNMGIPGSPLMSNGKSMGSSGYRQSNPPSAFKGSNQFSNMIGGAPRADLEIALPRFSPNPNNYTPSSFTPSGVGGGVSASMQDSFEMAGGNAGDNSGGEGAEVASEIALLEAQLEIKRLEARLLQLKTQSKPKPVSSSTPTNISAGIAATGGPSSFSSVSANIPIPMGNSSASSTTTSSTPLSTSM